MDLMGSNACQADLKLVCYQLLKKIDILIYKYGLQMIDFLDSNFELNIAYQMSSVRGSA